MPGKWLFIKKSPEMNELEWDLHAVQFLSKNIEKQKFPLSHQGLAACLRDPSLSDFFVKFSKVVDLSEWST